MNHEIEVQSGTVAILIDSVGLIRILFQDSRDELLIPIHKRPISAFVKLLDGGKNSECEYWDDTTIRRYGDEFIAIRNHETNQPAKAVIVTLSDRDRAAIREGLVGLPEEYEQARRQERIILLRRWIADNQRELAELEAQER